MLQVGQKCQNFRVVLFGCIHHFFSLAAKFKPLFSKWRPKNKNGRQKRKPNITGLIIDIQSRVICQNVHCLNRYLI